MYEYTPTALTIKKMAEETFIFPYCKHKILTVTQVGDKGKVEGLDMVGGQHRTQRRASESLLGLLPGPLRGSPSTSTSSRRN